MRILGTYKLPAENAAGSINAISADGKVAVGTVSYNSCTRPVVWTSTDQPKELLVDLDVSGIWSASATSVSANGKYVLLYITGPSPRLAVYDTQNETYTTVDVDEVSNIKTYAIDNNGNFFCRIANNTDYIDKTYYYAFAEKKLLSLEYFASVYAPEANAPLTNTGSVPMAVSADGTVIVGAESSYGGDTWYLKRNLEGVSVSGVSNVDAHFTGTGKAAVTYTGVESPGNGITIKRYDLYMDDVKLATNTAEKERFDIDVTAGTHTFFVKAVYDNGGKEVVSDKSDVITLAVPKSYEITLKENFESGSLDNNFWTHKLLEGNSGEILLWSVSGGDYQNNTFFVNVTNTVNKPYKASLTSRFFSNTNADKTPYLSFYAKRIDVNAKQTNLDSDVLQVEYTTDGDNWHKITEVKAADTNLYNWSFYNVALKDVVGKDFQLRFVASSEGKAVMRWCLDYISVGTEYEGHTPEGLRCIKNGGSTKIDWKNGFGAYEVSCLNNSNVITDYNVGNNGEPMMTAVDLSADKMKDYVGMYITSVSDFIYDSPYCSAQGETCAEAIVYADGKEVARGNFAAGCTAEPVSSVAPLDKAVKIEEGKTYRIAVRIYNYGSDQTPLYYQSGNTNPDYQTGVTDLYSEDEGATWNTIYEFNKNNEDSNLAYCVWPIRANITEDATLPTDAKFDATLIGYNVYRNGERINNMPVYASNRYIVDNTNSTEGAEYRIQAFYNDCTVSPLSDIAVVTAISTNIVDSKIGVSIDGKNISLKGNFDNFTITDLAGNTVVKTANQVVSTSGMHPGVYILNVVKGGRKDTYKITVK